MGWMEMKLIEVSIILIIILLIFGVVLTATENLTENVNKAQQSNYIEKLTSEVIDNLINNPGVPVNWNKYGKGTPGLAIVNKDNQTIPNTVSYQKLISLGDNYNKLVYQNLFDSKIHSSMELVPKESSISSVKIGENVETNNVFSLSRLVKCDFYKNYVLIDFQNEGKCNKHHDQSKYSCSYFKVFPGNLKNSDYYLLIDNAEKYDLSYIIGTTRVVKEQYWTTAISDCIYLNDEIEFYDDTSAVEFVHLDKPNPHAVLVSVPKNFNKELLEYDYFRTNDCEFVLKAWF